MNLLKDVPTLVMIWLCMAPGFIYLRDESTFSLLGKIRFRKRKQLLSLVEILDLDARDAASGDDSFNVTVRRAVAYFFFVRYILFMLWAIAGTLFFFALIELVVRTASSLGLVEMGVPTLLSGRLVFLGNATMIFFYIVYYFSGCWAVIYKTEEGRNGSMATLLATHPLLKSIKI